MSAVPEPGRKPTPPPLALFLPAPEGVTIIASPWIPLAMCHIAQSYQRPEPDDDRLSKLTAVWDMNCCGSLHISWRDGTFWIVDGQTRAQAARRRGLDRLPAVILYGLTEQEEAEVFLHLNRDRLAVGSLSRHKAEVTAQEPRAVAIDKVLTEHRLVAWYTAPEGWGTLQAIGKAEDVFKWGGPELLSRTITILNLAFPEDSGRFQGKYLAGLGFFLSHNPWEASDDRVARLLKKVTTSKLDELAYHAQQLAGAGRTNKPIYMAKAIAAKVYRRTDWEPEK